MLSCHHSHKKMKSVIFDLDGTLLDTLDDLTASTNFALKSCNYPLHTVDEVRRMVGNGVAMLIRRAMPAGHTQQQFDDCFGVFREYYSLHCNDNTKPYDGILDMLNRLYSSGVGLAVASNKLQPAVQKLVAHYFPMIKVAVGDSPEYGRKPAPDMLIKAMKQLDSTPHDTLYVGDSEVDVATARNAAVRCVSVLWGFRDKEQLLANGATQFAHTPCEILSFMDL